jgi:hypothetical protein
MRLKLFCSIWLYAFASPAIAQYTPTMEADPSEIGIEGNVLINELLSAFTPATEQNDLKLCKLIQPSYQERRKSSYRRYAKGAKGELDEALRCLVFKSGEQKDVPRYLRAGLSLSDLYCDTYFRRISLHSSKRRFARSGINDVGAAVSAILGLASVTGAVTGGISAGFGVADGFIRNYDDTFLVASDLPGLQTKVRSKQEEYRAALVAKTPDEYPDATTAIIRYANFCSFTGMRAMINKTLTESSTPTESMSAITKRVSDAMIAAETINETVEAARLARAAAKVAPGTPAPAPAVAPVPAIPPVTNSTILKELPPTPQ